MPLVPVDVLAVTLVGREKFNLLLAAVRAAIYNPIPLGGSLDTAHPGDSYQRVVGCVPFKLPSTVEAGGVWKAHVLMDCEDAAVTITPKIRNVTDGTDAVIGSACSGTDDAWTGTGQDQLLTFTPAVGKIYELWAMKSGLTKECWIVGTLRRTDA